MATLFNSNDPNEDKVYKKMIISCIAAASLVVLLFLVLLYMNADKKKVKSVATSKPEAVEEEFEYGKSNLKSSDLDFWDMYDEDEEEIEDEDLDDAIPYKDGKKKNNKKDVEKENDEITDNNAESDPGSKDEADNDDNHLAVASKDGSLTYYEILEDVRKNNYELKTPLDSDPKGKLIYKSESITARNGIDLSKNNGNVDFAKVKADGIDFVMLRIGNRGYSSGAVSLDEMFTTYANNARVNGLYIGVYFVSAATNEQEAIEEASFSVGAIKDYGIRYPVAMDLDSNIDDSSRTDTLTMKDRTKIVKAFSDTVKQYGYNPVIRASRDTLISKINLEDLSDVDFWVVDSSNPTDYPYHFSMWQYANDGRVDGTEGDVKTSLSFVKYEEK